MWMRINISVLITSFIVFGGLAYAQKNPLPICPECPACPSVTCPSPTVCEGTCSGDVAVVYKYDSEQRKCVKWYAYPCAPYGCDKDGKTCATSCITDAQCSQGAQCSILGLCSTAAPTCKDPFSVEENNGSIWSCIPYTCIAGTCMDHCEQLSDCYIGYTCENERCVQTP
jgi:hypothetical protein